MTSALPLIDAPTGSKQRALGSLEVLGHKKQIKLPLKGVDIEARVIDRLAHVTVTEVFQNPHKEHLEAVYIFPLSGGCAVSSFKMKVGDRVIEGAVNERQKARAEYAEAIQDGKRAALLEQERDDVFTVQVGNLPPGEEVTVILSYSEKLAYFENGTTEIRLPLVVAQRYIAGQPLERDSVGEGIEPDTDKVPDASRISPPRLLSGVDPKVALSLCVTLAGAQMVEDLSCSQHATKFGANTEGITVKLSQENELLDRDFVLRWRLAGDEVSSRFLVFPSAKENTPHFAMLSLLPPRAIDIATAPRDIIFVLDRSGSMQGIKMTSAARACAYLLSTLGPNDRFAIQAFDTAYEWLEPGTTTLNDRFFDADIAGIDEGAKYLRTIFARGGTEIHGAMESAITEMSLRKKTAGRQSVIVLLTDGQVGDESNVFKLIQSKLGDIRVFTIGIDSAVNDGFLRRLASLGGGTVSLVEPTTAIETALEQVSREIGTPLIQQLSLEDAGCSIDLDSVAPKCLTDVFEGRAVTAFFQINAKDLEPASAIKVKGSYPDGTPFSMVISPTITDVQALPQLWAKERIVDLEDQYRVAVGTAQTALHDKIVAIAVEHGLLTKFTAFVVVDHSEIVNKDGKQRTIVQPVHEPAQWEMNAAPQAQAAWGAAPGASWGGAASYGSPNPQALRAMSQAKSSGWGAPAAPASAPMPQAAPSPSNAPPPASPGSTPGFFAKAVETGFNRLRKQASTTGNMPALGGSGGSGSGEEGSAPNSAQRRADSAFLGVRKLIEALLEAFKKACAEIQGGKIPEGDLLETKRKELLSQLAKYDNASELPALQRYLRSDAIKFIAAICGAKSTNEKLRSIADSQLKTLAQLEEEMHTHANSPALQPFWHSTV